MMAASFMRFWRDAPEKPMAREAIASKSTSGASGLSRQWTLRISTLPALSGRSTGTRRSKRPGLNKALSRMSARFVAAMTITPVFPEKPSISVRIWLRVCSRSSLDAKPPPDDLCRPMASISSMKMMHGAFFFASANKLLIRDAPTPTNISTNSEPEQEMKGTPASPATARASKVLPVPGGPSSITPLGDWAPTLSYFSGFDRKSTTSSSSSLDASQPATSSNVTPVWGSISILLLGWSMPMGPPGPPMPPMPPMPPPRRPRKKRPPSSTKGKRRLAANPARASPSPVGAAWTAKGTDLARNCVTSSGTSVGRISTECLAPSASSASKFLESAEKTTRSTPSLPTTSKNSETAHLDPSAAKAALLEARAAPAASEAPNARRPCIDMATVLARGPLARGPLRRAVVGSCIEKAATSLPRRSAASAREREVFGIVVCVFSRARLQKAVRVGVRDV
mmetsp:Transcript_23764/g.66801  ORF Transcript_23764/g.66801 Transcript_23764/m.66801 type:complete len:453 (-) Transcript_23764:93-1451(-)